MLVTNFVNKKGIKFYANSVVFNNVSKLVADIQQNLLT